MSVEGHTCVTCEKECPGSSWEPGQVCIGGCLFACSVECGVTWAKNGTCCPGATVEECYKDEEGVDRFRTVYTV